MSIGRLIPQRLLRPGPLRQGGRVPSLQDVAGMTDAELSLLLRRFGVDQARVQLTREAVVRALRQLTNAQNPEPAVVEEALRRAEAAVRRDLQFMAKEAIRARELDALPDDELLAWTAVLDSGTCESCRARHDMEPRLLSEWEWIGTPGSDNLICDGGCRCKLTEASIPESEIPTEEELMSRISVGGTLIGGGK